MKTSKIALLSVGGIVLGAIFVAALAVRFALDSSGQLFAHEGGRADREPGELTTENRELSGFDAIEINGSWSVDVRQGDDWQVDLSYPENYLDVMDVSVRGDRLRLNGERLGSFFGGSNARFAAEIVMPGLEDLEVAGSNRVTLSGFEGEQLMIEAAGANQISGEDGRYGELELSVAGASDIELAEFTFTHADVDMAGASNLELTMDGGELTGSLAGAGRIQYFGAVSREAVDVAGFGSVGPAER